MRIAEDVISVNGITLIGRGVRVSAAVLERLIEIKRNAQVAEPILIDLSEEEVAHAG